MQLYVLTYETMLTLKIRKSISPHLFEKTHPYNTGFDNWHMSHMYICLLLLVYA